MQVPQIPIYFQERPSMRIIYPSLTTESSLTDSFHTKHRKMPGDETEEHWFRVINNSGAAQKYIFFAPPPSSDFLTPAWIASDKINNETVWDIHTTAYLYAGMSLHYVFSLS